MHLYLQLGGPSGKRVLITVKPFQRNIVRACVHTREREREREKKKKKWENWFHSFFFHSGIPQSSFSQQ